MEVNDIGLCVEAKSLVDHRRTKDPFDEAPEPACVGKATEVSDAAIIVDSDHCDVEQGEDTISRDDDSELPFPGFVPTAFYRFGQTRQPRLWCIQMITSPYPF